jgi:hypothetical protein
MVEHLDEIDKEFNKTYKEFTVASLHGGFKGLMHLKGPKEIPFAATKEEEQWIRGVCALFEEKYGKKLDYEFKNRLCYFKYSNEENG